MRLGPPGKAGGMRCRMIELSSEGNVERPTFGAAAQDDEGRVRYGCTPENGRWPRSKISGVGDATVVDICAQERSA